MSYRTTIKLQHPLYWSSALSNPAGLAERVILQLGSAARLVSLTETMDEAVVEYDLGGDNQFDSHHTVLQRFEWAAGTLAVQAFEAEVVQIVRYGIQAATLGGLTALGATAKQKGEVVLVASVLAAFAGFLVGEFLPQQQVIFRATRHPLHGWMWTHITPPPPFGWSPSTS